MRANQAVLDGQLAERLAQEYSTHSAVIAIASGPRALLHPTLSIVPLCPYTA